jgi:succinate-semialdehyde dehydrogenase / glutarate-semialdehyde dehydrogenase
MELTTEPRLTASSWVAGNWTGSSAVGEAWVSNPATGKLVGNVWLADEDTIMTASRCSAEAFSTWQAMGADARASILRQAAKNLRSRGSTIAATLTREQGKPLHEAASEVAASAALLDFYAEEGMRNHGRVLMRPSGQRSLVIHQPIGLVAAFTPWNFPVFLMVKKLAAALAAGCSIIIKPAEETPFAAALAFQCLVDTDLPANTAQLLFGDPSLVSSRLIESATTRKISFTGSVAVGRQLLAKAGAVGLPATMELGGHAPVIIGPDGDVEAITAQCVAQKFRNAGQACVAPTRFFIHRSVYDRFVECFSEAMSVLRVGDGADPETQMGPLALPKRVSAVEALITDAVNKGSVQLGGQQHQGSGNFVHPSLLLDNSAAARISYEEPFGPVALAAPFSDYDQALEQANGLPFGLAAFVFVRDGQIANRLADRLEAGMVGVNSFTIGGVDAPFGGVKASGMGSEGGPEGLKSYLVTKAIHSS